MCVRVRAIALAPSCTLFPRAFSRSRRDSLSSLPWADSSTARRDAAPADSTLENSSYCLTPSFEATGQDSNQRRAAVSTAVGPNMPLRVYFFRRSKLFFGISDFLWMPRTISKREQPFPCFGIRRSFYRRICSSKWFSRERQSRKQISVLFDCEYSFSS